MRERACVRYSCVLWVDAGCWCWYAILPALLCCHLKEKQSAILLNVYAFAIRILFVYLLFGGCVCTLRAVCTRMWYGAHHVYRVICSYAVDVAASSVYFRVHCCCCCYRRLWRRCHSTSAAVVSVFYANCEGWVSVKRNVYMCMNAHVCAQCKCEIVCFSILLVIPTTIFNALPFLLR